MQDSPTVIGFRASTALAREIEAAADAEGISKADFARRAAKLYLEGPGLFGLQAPRVPEDNAA